MDNDMTYRIVVVYARNDTEVSWSIVLGAIYDKN